MPTEINSFLLCSGTNLIIMNNNNPDMVHPVEIQRSPEEIILAFLVLQMKHARVMAEMMRVLRRIQKARKNQGLSGQKPSCENAPSMPSTSHLCMN